MDSYIWEDDWTIRPPDDTDFDEEARVIIENDGNVQELVEIEINPPADIRFDIQRPIAKAA